MIRSLSKLLDIPLETLVREYPLDKPVKNEKKATAPNTIKTHEADKMVQKIFGSPKPKKGFRQAKKGKKYSKLKHA